MDGAPTPTAVAKGLVRRFPGKTVLDGIDLELRPGEVLGLVGPNGGGKSTLLLLFAGLLRPSAGTVAVTGRLAHQVALERRGSVGLITSVAGLYPLFTGRENLHFFGGLHGVDRAEIDQRVELLAEELGLGEELDRRVNVYSSGTSQKVSLLRALLLSPRLLLLDEPTTNLDPPSADLIYRTIRDRADRGLSVVWATHDLHAAELLCDRVAFLDGRIKAMVEASGGRSMPPDSPLLATWRATLR